MELKKITKMNFGFKSVSHIYYVSGKKKWSCDRLVWKSLLGGNYSFFERKTPKRFAVRPQVSIVESPWRSLKTFSYICLYICLCICTSQDRTKYDRDLKIGTQLSFIWKLWPWRLLASRNFPVTGISAYPIDCHVTCKDRRKSQWHESFPTPSGL